MDLHSQLAQIVREVLRHLLGERRDDRALTPFDAQIDLGEQIVDLALGPAHLDLGVDETGRADDLFDHTR